MCALWHFRLGDRLLIGGCAGAERRAAIEGKLKENKATAIQSPCLKLYEECLIPKGRLSVSQLDCAKDSMDDAVKETVEL